ncbi:elongation factor G [Sandaracinus amylolyticus]|nr:elongation factor G [Sandaracinus amylolyticus]
MLRHLPIERLRNVGIVAHVDAGKTTLTERILFYTGRIHTIGEVHHGTTTTDSEPSERARGITIQAAAITCDWRDHRIQLIDTPGHVDFGIEVERSLRVLDGAVVVIDAVAGVQPQTETVWRQADRHDVPRIVFVNKLDRPGASFERALASIEARLGARVAPIALPIGEGEDFVGVVDPIRRRALIWRGEGDGRAFDEVALSGALVDVAERARARLVDLCADVDPGFAEAYVERGDADDATFVRALRRGTATRSFVPVLAGAAYANKGVQPLLDAMIALLPSPADRPPVRGRDGEERPPSEDAALAALCFKVVHDDWGQRAFVRVYSGTMRRGDPVRLAPRGERVRIGRLVRVFAASVEDVEEVRAGGIAAVLGGSIASGETLCDPAAEIVLEAIDAPAPVITVALEPTTRGDRDRMGTALHRLCSEDPSLRLRTDPETGETTLSGMGELHLQIAVERLETTHRVKVRASAPRVAYRETVSRVAEHETKHVKMSGGPGQYAHVRVRLEPGARGTGVVFVDQVRGGEIPAQYVSGVEKGVRLAATSGVLSGSPVVDVVFTLLGGSFHSNDSSELAFQICAERAFREIMPLAGPVLLEPVMELEIDVPEGAVGSVIGDLGARRGRVVALEGEGDARRVRALAPLAELAGYVAALRSLTQGRGTASMRLEGYAAVPESLVAKAIAKA